MQTKAYQPLIVIAVVFAAMFAFAAYRQANESKDAVPWRASLSAAREESAKTGKPVLAYFTATWCPPCQQMKAETWSDPRVGSDLPKYTVPVKIDVDEHPDLAMQFNVSGIPHTQLINPDGSLGEARVGFIPSDALLRWLSGR